MHLFNMWGSPTWEGEKGYIVGVLFSPWEEE